MEFLTYLSTSRTDFGEGFWNMITKFGEETMIIILLCIIYWCISKNMAYIVGFTFFLSGFLVQGLKITFRIDRPWILDSNFKPVDAAYDTATGYSFPSGHTQAATAVYSAFGFQIKNWIRYLWFVIPFAVAFSRMYLGVHTPKDVITSLVLTFAISFLISYFMKKTDKNYMRIFLLMIILVGAALLIYSMILYSMDIIIYKYVSDCCKTAGAGIGFALGVYLERKYVNFKPKTCRISCQIYKVFLGILGVLLIQIGLKQVFMIAFNESLVADFIRYLLITVWVAYVWPLLFTKLNTAKE